jgi:hypothetical protein
MAMDGAGAPVRATRAIAYKLAFTKLDDFSKAGSAVDINLSLRPGPRLLLHGSIRHHSTFYPRFHAKRYSRAFGHRINAAGRPLEAKRRTVLWPHGRRSDRYEAVGLGRTGKSSNLGGRPPKPPKSNNRIIFST